MSYARQMLGTCKVSFNVDAGLLAAVIEALNDCAQACMADTGCDLSEPNVTEMVRCIRLCLDCADVCVAAAGVISRQAAYDADVVAPLLHACAAACKSCGDECERHARMHEHCRVCAEACRRCERACRDLLAALG
ncbi:MAG: four-helix bundle copper-binding protein [Actinobacteria bacterium]|nr:four-helix bundle copper-binding protein [Actinomycetota bacterium]